MFHVHGPTHMFLSREQSRSCRHLLFRLRGLLCAGHVIIIPFIPSGGERKTVVVQSLSRVRLFVTPWTAEHQASLSFIISQSLLKLMSIESSQ